MHARPVPRELWPCGLNEITENLPALGLWGTETLVLRVLRTEAVARQGHDCIEDLRGPASDLVGPESTHGVAKGKHPVRLEAMCHGADGLGEGRKEVGVEVTPDEALVIPIVLLLVAAAPLKLPSLWRARTFRTLRDHPDCPSAQSPPWSHTAK